MGYSKYLEIGCAGNDCFENINIPFKVGVDPSQGGTLRLTSDEYFALTTERFDLIFIDGLPYAAQVVRDVEHALNRLRPNIAFFASFKILMAQGYELRHHFCKTQRATY